MDDSYIAKIKNVEKETLKERQKV